jgi:D-serine dehydratase
LRGVEGFEGLVSGAEGALRVAAFVDFLAQIATRIDAEDLWGDGPAILTAGGSAFYDIVARRFASLDLRREKSVLIRSGCYLTHDSKMYDLAFDEIARRMPDFARIGRPAPALEVWTYVQSRPEPTRALVTMGKRDAAYDPFLPEPKLWYRPGTAPRHPQALTGHVCVSLNDQHGYLDVPVDSPLRVGDMVGFGVSHPCLTFDKWRVMPIVDRDYGVVEAIRTFF